MTPPRYIKAFALSSLIIGSLPEAGAIDMAEAAQLRSWFRENQVFVNDQFKYLSLPIESGIDRETVWYIERYLRQGRSETERMLGRALYYLPLFEQELRAKGLPDALKYLPMVESGLHADISSPVGAMGLWQFMPATARHFKLQINHLVDERRDPYRSTQAAVKLLDMLYKEFGDWHLVLAAYNCGPGRVLQAVKRANSRQYIKIRRYLPDQTQSYITKFKAVAYIAEFYGFFGLEPASSRHLKGEVVRLALTRPVAFGELARLCNIPASTLRALNPAYLQGIIPGGGRRYSLVVPAEMAPVLAAAGMVTWEGEEDSDFRLDAANQEQNVDSDSSGKEHAGEEKSKAGNQSGDTEDMPQGKTTEWNALTPPSSEKQSKSSKYQEVLLAWYQQRQGVKIPGR